MFGRDVCLGAGLRLPFTSTGWGDRLRYLPVRTVTLAVMRSAASAALLGDAFTAARGDVSVLDRLHERSREVGEAQDGVLIDVR